MKDKKELKEQKGTVAIAKPKKKKKVLIIVLVIIVVVAAVIGVSVKNMTKQVEMISNQVEVEPVEKRDLSDAISLKGTIAGISKTNVTSKALAEITSVNVQPGDVVKKGDVLCTIDSASIEEKIAELEKNLNNSQAVNNINSQQTKDAVAEAQADQARQLEDAQTQINQAQENYNGAQMMYDKGEADFASLLNAKRALESAEKNYETVLETTNRAIKTAQTALELNKYKDSDATSKDTLSSLREQLADCEIVAPTGGVVTAVNVSVGDINAEKVTILTIEDTSSLKVSATVSEADILKIQEGMKTIVTSDATGDEEITGTVSRVVRVKSQASGSGDASASGYAVEISIDNTNLLVGMAAKAKIMIQEKGEVLAIPYDLIQRDESGNAFVMVAEDNADGSATVVRKNIEVGEEVDYYTEITGGDLKEGDKLIYDYTYTMTEGQTLTQDQMYSAQGLGAMGGAGVSAGASAGGSVSVEVVN